SVEHWNEEAGEVWMNRVKDTYEKVAWLNPVPQDEWGWTQSTDLAYRQMEGHMYPLTLSGLEKAMAYLAK
ncbi:MAG TPA: hypothetical protein DIW43_06660, partial [Spongiibacteraceae bacterium]|nr:hypothetical protein [Spongiibacteraceae bacterium]